MSQGGPVDERGHAAEPAQVGQPGGAERAGAGVGVEAGLRGGAGGQAEQQAADGGSGAAPHRAGAGQAGASVELGAHRGQSPTETGLAADAAVVRILLADDHTMFRQGIRQVLSCEPDLKVVGEVGDGPGVLRRVQQDDVDVVVLDLSLPGMSGLEVLRRLEEEAPRVAVVILSMYPEDRFAASLLHRGAGAYVSKSEGPDELVAAVRAVVVGRTYLTPTLRALGDAAVAPHERLSGREQQVFHALIRGATVSEVAAETDLAISTVSTLVGRIRDKLQVASVGELILYAHKAGLLG